MDYNFSEKETEKIIDALSKVNEERQNLVYYLIHAIFYSTLVIGMMLAFVSFKPANEVLSISLLAMFGLSLCAIQFINYQITKSSK